MLTQKNIFNINNYKYLIFDCDGVCLDSNQIKSNLFYDIAKSVDSAKAKEFLKYHKNNGGMSRYEKFRYFVTNMLNVENLNLVQELISKYNYQHFQGALPADQRLSNLFLSLSVSIGSQKSV